MRRSFAPRAAVLAFSLLLCAGPLAGCATPMFAGMTLGELGLLGSLFSAAATGKGLGDHAMDVATGRDCRVLEGLARGDRRVCEQDGSPALADDWEGLAGLAGDDTTTWSSVAEYPPPRAVWDQ